jgi:CRP-like cAMP-binding protein
MLPQPFSLLPPEALSTRKLDRAAVIVRRDDPAEALFFMVAGRADLLRYTEQGDRIVVHRAQTGETFCEAALFSPRYHCDVIAAEPVELIVIGKSSVLKKMRTDPDFALAISARFAGQIQDYRRRNEITAIRSANDRVFAAVADGLLSADIKSLAAQIGLSHEATYRALSALARQGRLIKTGRGAYALP